MIRSEYYICISLDYQNKIIAEDISAASPKEAASYFFEKFKITPEKIMGPYFKKKVRVNDIPIEFNGPSKQAVYDGWIVNAFPVKNPENHAFLLFIRREDGIAKQQPKEKKIVPTSDLRYL